MSQCDTHPVLPLDTVVPAISGGDALAVTFRGTTSAPIASMVGFQNGTWNGRPMAGAVNLQRFLLEPATLHSS